MKKRRHHYVWQHYLRAWSTDGAVACLRRNGALFTTGTSELAVETDFYRLREIGPKEIKFVEEVCIADASPGIQELLRGWIPGFVLVYRLHELLRARGIDVDSGEAAEVFDEAIHNHEEDLHASIERDAIPYLEALRQEDLSFLDDDDVCAGFLHYLSVQYMRTAKMRTSIFSALGDVTGVSIENAWGLMSHVLATSMGYGMFVRRDSTAVALKRAPGDAEFITTDHPVVNLHAVRQPEMTLVEELELHYPITPKLALGLAFDRLERSMAVEDVGADEVDRLNQSLYEYANRQVYATREGILAAFSET